MTEIAHDAIVRQVDGDTVTVTLLNHESCAGCHAEKACGISAGENKTVLIQGKYNVKPGDRVTVTMKQSEGFRAVFLGYMVPLMIFLLSLIFLSALSVNELISGLISLGILVPYYLLFSLFRQSMNTRFSFHIKM